MIEEKKVATIYDVLRICHSHYGCMNCPIRRIDHTLDCGRILIVHFDIANRVILEWCDEHPQKTYAQDFFEKFPKADICRGENEKEYPNVCRNRIFGLETECGWCFKHSCSNCWNEIMPEEETK